MWKRILSDTKGTMFVAEVKGRIVGFADCGPIRDSEEDYTGELYAIYVNEAMQGKGVGRMLSHDVAKNLKSRGFDSMLVWVLAENPFRRFYESLGGQQVRTRDITIGGKTLTEWGYGWKTLAPLIDNP